MYTSCHQLWITKQTLKNYKQHYYNKYIRPCRYCNCDQYMPESMHDWRYDPCLFGITNKILERHQHKVKLKIKGKKKWFDDLYIITILLFYLKLHVFSIYAVLHTNCTSSWFHTLVLELCLQIVCRWPWWYDV